MAVVELSEEQFNESRVNRQGQAGTVTKERAWFATKNRERLGIVTFDTVDRDWGYVILEPDESGCYRAVDNDVSIESMDAARHQLVSKMSSAGKTY